MTIKSINGNNTVIACPECGWQTTKMARLLANADFECSGCRKTRWSEFVRYEPQEFRKSAELVQANLVIMKSEDGEEWEPVLPDDVPTWVKQPDVIEHLASGEACQAPGESTWYGALHANDSGVSH